VAISPDSEIVFEPATEYHLTAVSALLHSAGLVPLDETSQFGEQYVVAQLDGEVLGVAGIEIHGADGLLRSVAVDAEFRSQGIGAALVEDRLDYARSLGLRGVYLLTTTAPGWFERLGFERVDRTAAPEPVAASQEWSHACPSSSVAMRLLLRPT